MGKRYVAKTANRTILVTITVTSILFIVAVSYVFYSRDIPLQAQEKTEELAVDTQPVQDLASIAEKDTDGDGLSDWEEVLWSTDPNNADSDSDGIYDKADVLVSQKKSDLALQVQEPVAPSTVTQAASRDLFGSYMYSLKSGEELSLAEQEAMVDQTLQKVVSLVPRSTFSKNDLATTPATRESVRTYRSAIEQLFTRIGTKATDESASLYKMAYGNREEGIAELVAITALYRGYVEELKEIPVPADALGTHTALIIHFENYIYTLEGFTYFYTDPMRSAVSINTVTQEFTTVQGSLKALATYFDTATH